MNVILGALDTLNSNDGDTCVTFTYFGWARGVGGWLELHNRPSIGYFHLAPPPPCPPFSI